MNRTTAFVLALGLVVGAVTAPDAEAAWRLGQKKSISNPKRIEMPEGYRESKRFDSVPMEFKSGTLRREGLGDWWLGDYRLQLSAETVIIGPDGEGGFLQEGREVAVMGAVTGNTINGWSVRLLGDEMPLMRESTEVVKKPSDSDPDVGEIVDGPR
jgi:hypothetical protein